MHFILNNQLFNDAINIASKWSISEIEIHIRWKVDEKPEKQKVRFISEDVCHIDGTNYTMKAETLILENTVGGGNTHTPEVIVWLMPDLPPTLN